jgi:hypothetical protein
MLFFVVSYNSIVHKCEDRYEISGGGGSTCKNKKIKAYFQFATPLKLTIR